MKTVTAMRVKRNKMGAVPNGFVEGSLVGFTDEEIETLNKNPHLSDCFEIVQLRTPKETPNAGQNSSADAGAPAPAV